MITVRLRFKGHGVTAILCPSLTLKEWFVVSDLSSSGWNANSDKTLICLQTMYISRVTVQRKSESCVPLGAELFSGPEKKCKEKPEMENLV